MEDGLNVLVIVITIIKEIKRNGYKNTILRRNYYVKFRKCKGKYKSVSR